MLPLVQVLGLVTSIADLVSKKNLTAHSTIAGVSVAAGGIATVQSGAALDPASLEGLIVQVVLGLIGLYGWLKKN